MLGQSRADTGWQPRDLQLKAVGPEADETGCNNQSSQMCNVARDTFWERCDHELVKSLGVLFKAEQACSTSIDSTAGVACSQRHGKASHSNADHCEAFSLSELGSGWDCTLL